MAKIKKILLIIGGLLFISIPLILLWLPATYFDKGKSICLSQQLFHQRCYGCGMTKAVQHLLHAEIKTAMEYNKLSLLVLPVLVFLWGQNLWFIYKNIRKLSLRKSED